MKISFDFHFGFWQRIKIFFGIPIKVTWSINNPTNELSLIVRGDVTDKTLLGMRNIVFDTYDHET